jgi:hypothetical protein
MKFISTALLAAFIAKVKNHYLRDAIDAVLAGQASATTETRPKALILCCRDSFYPSP